MPANTGAAGAIHRVARSHRVFGAFAIVERISGA